MPQSRPRNLLLVPLVSLLALALCAVVIPPSPAFAAVTGQPFICEGCTASYSGTFTYVFDARASGGGLGSEVLTWTETLRALSGGQVEWALTSLGGGVSVTDLPSQGLPGQFTHCSDKWRIESALFPVIDGPETRDITVPGGGTNIDPAQQDGYFIGYNPPGAYVILGSCGPRPSVGPQEGFKPGPPGCNYYSVGQFAAFFPKGEGGSVTDHCSVSTSTKFMSGTDTDTTTVNDRFTFGCQLPEEPTSVGAASSREGNLVSLFRCQPRCPLKETVRMTQSPSRQLALLDNMHFQAFVSPLWSPGCDEFYWQAKRQTGNSWTTLGRTNSPGFSYKWKVAGYLEARVVDKYRYGTAYSNNGPGNYFEVQFPDRHVIATDAAVLALAKKAWSAELKVSSNGKTVQELGFWVVLDTCNAQYGQEPQGAYLGHHPVPAFDPKDATINLGALPPDDPKDPPVDGCAKYAVASFHTHVPLTWAFSKKVWPVGPSQADIDADKNQRVAGLVYDYLPFPNPAVDQVPAGYGINRPAMLWEDKDGPDRRQTPV